MAQKLAISISGAVSLGSYEAGVLYEVIRAVGLHNKDKAADDPSRVEVDVITGASAGGISATIVAQKLMFEGESLDGAYENALYRSWVQDIDIAQLLKKRPDDDRHLGLFSSAYVAELLNKYIMGRYTPPAEPVSRKHPAAADEIHLGLALSNLNGVDYSQDVVGFSQPQKSGEFQAEFTYTRHQDRLVRVVTETDDELPFWRSLLAPAQASGAFPFAFRAMGLMRSWEKEYFSEEGADPFEPEEKAFAYTDGGLFENEPLGMAKAQVNELDMEHLETQNRFYLYIAPRPRAGDANSTLSPERADYARLAGGLIRAIRAQSTFQDWICTAKQNEKVIQFNAQAEGLAKVITPANAVAFKGVAQILLDSLYENRGGDEFRKSDAERLKVQFQEEYEAIADTAARETWLMAVQVLEKAADIGEVDLMKVYTVTADNGELAGDAFHSFLGFFSEKLRKHDYDVGRNKAITFLKGIKELPSGQGEGRHLVLRDFEDSAPPEIDVNLGSATFRDVPEKERRAAKEVILKTLYGEIEQMQAGWAARKALKLAAWFLVRPRLDRLLCL